MLTRKFLQLIAVMMKPSTRIICGKFFFAIPLSILFLALTSFASASAEDGGKDTPYQKYYKRLSPAKSADVENALKIIFCASAGNKSDVLPRGLEFEIRDGAEHVPLLIDDRLCFEIPVNSAWAEHDAVLHVNTSIPIALAISISGRPPKATRLSYAELMNSIPAYQRVIASQGMLARVFMPAAHGLAMGFDKGKRHTVIVHAASGDIEYATDENGELHIPYDAPLGPVRVDLDAIPQECGPDTGSSR